MNKTVSLYILILLCVFSGQVFGERALNDEFNTNLNAWTLLNTPSAGGAVDIGLSGGKLNVSLTNNAQWQTQGIQSVQKYSVPTNGKLVVDFYGVNTFGVNGIDTHSYPWSAVCAYPNAGGCFNGWHTGWIAVKGWDAYNGDWVQTSAGGYTDLAGANAATLKHTIMEIDASFIKVYIADDFYLNLLNPTPLYTTATTNVFTSEELTNGLYVFVGGARYTSWYSGTCTESFDGVEVWRLGQLPSGCSQAIEMGYGMRGDLNHDCKVDLADLGEMTQVWLSCVDPQDILCAGL